MSAPPPIPPTAHARPPSAPVVKPRMSGCAIAAIISAVAGVMGALVFAMLASIVYPAFHSYITKWRAVQGYHMAREFQDAIDEYREQSGACPDNVAIGLQDGDAFELGDTRVAHSARAIIAVGALDSGNCGIEMRFANVDPGVDGKTLLLESIQNGWTCDGGTLDARYRASQCLASNLPTNLSIQTDSAP